MVSHLLKYRYPSIWTRDFRYNFITVIHCENESFVEISLKFDNLHTLCFRTKEGGSLRAKIVNIEFHITLL